MNETARKTSSYDEGKTKTLSLTCPFCGHEEKTSWDGLYKPRYFHCSECGEKYIYEPLADKVSILKPKDASCCEDPECREYELLAHCEQ